MKSLVQTLRIVTMVSCFLVSTFIIFAQDDEYYNQVFFYGTDGDISTMLKNVDTDLGEGINRKILRLFEEEHSLAVYSAAAAYLGNIRMTAAEKILIHQLHNGLPNEEYREGLIQALGKIGKTSSLQHLRDYYYNKKSTKRIKRAIIDAWGEIGDAHIEDVLLSIASDAREDEELRARAILALGKVKSHNSLEFLEKTATNRYEKKLIRMYSVYSPGEIGGESVLDTLGVLLFDDTHEVAEYAVKSISNIPSEKSGPYLVKALRSNYDMVRYHAVIGLAALQYDDAADILAFKAEYDSNELIRKEARKALETLRQQEQQAMKNH
jgi:HEAT repeat protein